MGRQVFAAIDSNASAPSGIPDPAMHAGHSLQSNRCYQLMPSAVPTDISTQLHMSLDDIISKDGAKTGGQTGRPPAAKAQPDRKTSHDRRGRGMFNVPRGIVKQRSSSFSASTYGLNLLLYTSSLVVHVQSPATCVQEQLGLDLAPVAELVSVKCWHATTARDIELYCCVRRRPKDYDTQQFIKVSTVSQACTSAVVTFDHNLPKQVCSCRSLLVVIPKL